MRSFPFKYVKQYLFDKQFNNLNETQNGFEPKIPEKDKADTLSIVLSFVQTIKKNYD